MQDNRKDDILIASAGALPVVWIAFKIAPYWKGNIFDVITQMDEIFAEPWPLCICDGYRHMAVHTQKLSAGRRTRLG